MISSFAPESLILTGKNEAVAEYFTPNFVREFRNRFEGDKLSNYSLFCYIKKKYRTEKLRNEFEK